MHIGTMRMVKEAKLTACGSGHVVRMEPTGREVIQVLHSCGRWTWADGNYCEGCGARLELIVETGR